MKMASENVRQIANCLQRGIEEISTSNAQDHAVCNSVDGFGYSYRCWGIAVAEETLQVYREFVLRGHYYPSCCSFSTQCILFWRTSPMTNQHSELVSQIFWIGSVLPRRSVYLACDGCLCMWRCAPKKVYALISGANKESSTLFIYFRGVLRTSRLVEDTADSSLF